MMMIVKINCRHLILPLSAGRRRRKKRDGKGDEVFILHHHHHHKHHILHSHNHNIHGPQQYSVFNQLLAICAVDVAAKHQRRRWGGKTAQLEVEWGNQRSKEEEGGMEKGEEGRGEM